MLTSKQILAILLHEYILERDVKEITQNVNIAWGRNLVSERLIRTWFAKFHTDDAMFNKKTSSDHCIAVRRTVLLFSNKSEAWPNFFNLTELQGLAGQILYRDLTSDLYVELDQVDNNFNGGQKKKVRFKTTKHKSFKVEGLLSLEQVEAIISHEIKLGRNVDQTFRNVALAWGPHVVSKLFCRTLFRKIATRGRQLQSELSRELSVMQNKHDIGGRLLDCQPGTSKYDKDLYRGQRRRPWLVFRLGTDSSKVSDELFSQYVDRIRETLLDFGILLDQQDYFLFFLNRVNPTSEGLDMLQREFEKALKLRDENYDRGPLSGPIAIYMLDCDFNRTTMDEMIEFFSEDISFFKIDADEVFEQINSCDYTDLKIWCEEFAEMLIKSENLPESLAFPRPIEKIEPVFGVKKSRVPNPNNRRNQDEYETADKENMYHCPQQQGNKANGIEPPPGLGMRLNGDVPSSSGAPPGLDHSSRQSSSNGYGPPPGLHLHGPPGINMAPPPGFPTGNPADASISEYSDPPLHLESDFDTSEEELDLGEPAIEYEKIRAIMREYELVPLKGGQLPRNDYALARTLCDEAFYRRFEIPFDRPLDNLHMMLVVNHAVSSTKVDIQNYVKELMTKCFERKYPDRLMKSFVMPRFLRESLDKTHKDLFFEITRLFGYVCVLRPKRIREDMQMCWATFWRCSEDISKLLNRDYDRREIDDNEELCFDIQNYISRQVEEEEREEAMLAREREEQIRRQEVQRIPPQNQYRGQEDRMVQNSLDDERRRRAQEVIERGQQKQKQLSQSSLDFDDSTEEELSDSNRVEERRIPRISRPDVDMERQRLEEIRRRKHLELEAREIARRREEEERRNYMRERDYEEQRRRGGEDQGRSEVPDFDESSVEDHLSLTDESETLDPIRDSELRDDVQVNSGFEEQRVVLKNVDEVAPQAYMYTKEVASVEKVAEDEYVPLWQKGEKRDPPETYRVLTTIPTLRDYHNPVEPYLRRIRDDGIYTNSEHYLDVQFRLMREDLVSPLRDGVDIYRKNGTTRNNRIGDGLNSDVMINVLLRIEGKQVTIKEGSELRHAILHPDTLRKLTIDRKEVKDGGLALLSSDNFVKDVHLVKIQDSNPKTKSLTDRKKDDFSKLESYISLVILDENKESPLKRKTVYKLAEGTSYLPSYQFVLENIKKVNPFIALPFERYIVYGKKVIYRPAFQRQMKDEEQIHDEQRIEKYYGDVRSAAKARLIATGQDSSSEEDDDLANQFGYVVKNRRKKNRPVDYRYCEERRLMKEPIFNEQIGVMSPEDGDKIKIDDTWYKVSSLLSDYHPDYLDESQRVAFCNTFNREISIIQGPPGTGKTHIGVNIVKTMLLNRQHWRITSPIMVICFTNSAIDQFLERILDMIDDCSELFLDNVPKMVRYGSKSQSDKLQKAGVFREAVTRNFKNNVTPETLQRCNSSFKDRGKVADALGTLSYGLYASRNKIGSYMMMSSVMDEQFQKEFRIFASTHKDSRDYELTFDEAFACWLLEKDFGERRSGPISANSFQPLRRDKAATMDDSADEFDESDDDGTGSSEEVLTRVLQRMNIACSGKDVIEGLEMTEEEDAYLSDSPWEVGGSPRNVSIFSTTDKEIGGRIFVPIDMTIVDQLAEEKDMILNAKPLKPEELKDIRSVFSLTRPKRWALYQYWSAVLRKRISENLPAAIEKYRKACEKVMQMQEECDAEIMRHALIIGATTTGCSRIRPLLERLKPKILVVEEAAEVLEAHILSALVPSLEQVVMIGDHQQLRPNPAVHELATTYGMQISMFERLVERGLPYSQLKKQHRMNVDIGDLIVRPSFYPNVIDADNVKEYPDVEGMAANLFFWSHVSREHSIDQVSWINDQEIRMIVHLVDHLLKQSYEYKDITIITTYAAQRSELMRVLLNRFGVDEGPMVETVDSYQGRENKIIIVSLVRSHRGQSVYTGIGFLSVVNRICVALTRAQHGMYIVGNCVYLSKQSELWDQVMANLKKRNRISYDLPLKCTTHGNEVFISSPEDFGTYSPEGGCDEYCEMAKPCGHVCQRRCHPHVEKEHIAALCREMCSKQCSREEYKHPCKKRCNEDCGLCCEYVDLELSCGHTITAPCWNIEKSKCDKLCSKKLVCGHNCTQKCGSACLMEGQCKENVNLQLKCGHVRVLECNVVSEYGCDIQCIERCEKTIMGCEHRCEKKCGEPCTVQCKEEVEVNLRCGHTAPVECCEVDSDEEFTVDEEKYPCKTPVRKVLEPCKHEGLVACYEEPETKNCTETCWEVLEKCGHECHDSCGNCYTTGKHCCQQRCKKTLNCGHSCSSKCGELCAPCPSYCDVSCIHKFCGMGKTGFPGFGRTCSQLCVMCNESCANRCAHRSCSKRCFEKCDVPPCNERCMNPLRCGHACLGLCGEICPAICATCKLADYEECINVLKEKKANKVLKLIQVPDCKHTFPVQFLDEHVNDLKKRNQNLTCPKEGCNKRLNGVLRYSQYCKKKFLDDNMNKQKALVSSDENAFLNTLKRLAYCAKPDYAQHCPSKRVKSFFTTIATLSTQMHAVVSKEENRPKLNYYENISKCIFALREILARMVSIKNCLTTSHLPVRFEHIVVQAYEDLLIFLRHTDMVEEAISYLQSHWKEELIGAVVPKMLVKLARLNIGLQMMVAWRKLLEDGVDLRDDVAKSLQKSLDLFLRMDERNQYLETMLKCEKAIEVAVPSMKQVKEYLNWEQLQLYEF